MSDFNANQSAQPQVLTPVTPIYVQAAPAHRGNGLLRSLLFMFGCFGLLSIVLLAGLFYIASTMAGSGDVWIDEVYHSGNRLSKHKVAIVSVEDVIMDSTAKFVLRQLKAAEEDEDVAAVVLRVDSPGGTINASDHIHRQVKKLCRGSGKTKPVVVSMQGLAASGGYYVSAPAQKIFAERTTMTGSIGVIASFLNASGLMEDFNVRMEVIKTGPRKDSGSPFRPMTDEERTRWDEVIGDAFQTFLEVVSEGRGMSTEQVRTLATGDVYTAREAKANGLIDEIGYLEDAIAEAESLAGVSDSQVVEYKRPLSLSDLLLGVSAAGRASVQIDLQSLFRANVPRVMFLTQASPITL
jgi:protease-4